MDRDRLLAGESLVEIVALQHARHRVLARQANHACRIHLVEPFGVETHLGSLAVEHLENLVRVGAGIGLDVFAGERLAGHVLAGGIADHSGEITNQEDHLVPQILELAHFVQ